MNILIFVAFVAVLLALGAWIGICISEKSRQIDADIAALVLSRQFVTDLDEQAQEWR